MKGIQHKQTTQESLRLGMALHADKETMETRIRGIFSRRSSRIASVFALVLAVALSVGCFTTACRPVSEVLTVQFPTPIASPEVIMADSSQESLLSTGVPENEIGSLLRFDCGYRESNVEGNRITVEDGKGKTHTFTWVYEGKREHSEPIPEGTYEDPLFVACRAAEIAVTVFGDQVPDGEIHINLYKHEDMDLVYYGIGFGGTPFETDGIYGYADAATGTVLYLDANIWLSSTKQYGNDFINSKIEGWDWYDKRYTEAHTSEKALATAMELIRSCFATAEIVPRDPEKWDAGSHTDGEQIDWQGGYEAVVDAYIRMDEEPCYYVQVAVPLEDGANPHITIFGCYPLGWEYCCNQIHDPAVLRQELEDLAKMRAGRTPEQEEGVEGPFRTAAPDAPATITDGPVETEPESNSDASGIGKYADMAESLVGTTFTPRTEDWKPGDSASEYSKIFAVKVGAYLDDGYEDSDPSLDANKALAGAERGNVLRFEWDGSFLYGIYDGNGNMIYADASTLYVRKAPVAEWMSEKPDCTCCILTWNW